MGRVDLLTRIGIATIVAVGVMVLPGLQPLGPIGGGVVAGVLEADGVTGGVKIGTLYGVVTVIPTLALVAVGAGLAAAIELPTVLVAGGALLIGGAAAMFSLVTGILGGVIGGVNDRYAAMHKH